MGLFNSFMKGLGFSDNSKKKNNPIVEDKNAAVNEKYNNFDNGLANSFVVNEFKNPNELTAQIPGLAGGLGGKNLIIYAPKDNKDIKILVECLRRKEACIVNLGLIKPVDADKILQFLSGAVYALKGSIKRLQGDLFLMAPEGINIMTQSKNN
ncbi:MAG: cell division protein SepF [Clostridia bacterium]|nr:cell division protein SepF [Clostridia bacterium]